MGTFEATLGSLWASLTPCVIAAALIPIELMIILALLGIRAPANRGGHIV